MLRSIRLTLTFWYIGILAAILCLFAWVLFTNVAANLAQDVNEVLASQAQDVANSIVAFRQAQQPAVSPEAASQPAEPPKTLQEEIDAGRLPELVTRWAEDPGRQELARPVRLIDRKGKPLLISKHLAQLSPPLKKSALDQARRGHAVYETFYVRTRRIRLITHPVVEADRLLYFVQVAAVLQQAEVSLDRLLRLLVWLIPLTLVTTSAVGWFLATKALRPVGRMTSQVHRIGRLQERVDVPHNDAELARLARTFNEMLQRLEGAFYRVRQFSAAASHELRTPLTIMKGELEVALRKRRTPEEYQRTLRTFLGTLDDMTQTVEELLMLARTEAAEGALEWRPVEIVAMTRHVRESLQPLADARKIQVTCPEHQPVLVRGEQRLLERLVANLLDNAIRHTPARGQVTVRAGHQRDNAYVIVQDTGPGIAADELPRIFDRFFSQRSEANGGRPSGLGLGLCRWIAEVHKGHIEVSSSPGQGATFTVWLPLSASPV